MACNARYPQNCDRLDGGAGRGAAALLLVFRTRYVAYAATPSHGTRPLKTIVVLDTDPRSASAAPGHRYSHPLSRSPSRLRHRSSASRQQHPTRHFLLGQETDSYARTTKSLRSRSFRCVPLAERHPACTEQRKARTMKSVRR